MLVLQIFDYTYFGAIEVFVSIPYHSQYIIFLKVFLIDGKVTK